MSSVKLLRCQLRRSGVPEPFRGASLRAQLRRDRTVDVAVNMVRTDEVDEPVGAQHLHNAGLDAREPQRHTVGPGELVEILELRRALRVDEVDSLEIEDDR